MKHFAIALAAIVLHKLITAMLSVGYNFFTEPFDLFRFLLDLAIFAVIYVAIRFLFAGAETLKR